LPLIAHSRENNWVTGESRSTGSAERTSVREHVRPSQTHAEEVVANAPGENFPVALRLLPARHRRHLTNLYFFARLTDDLGDEARDGTTDVTGLRLRLLDELAADVLIASDGPRVAAGAPTIFLGSRGSTPFTLRVDLRPPEARGEG